MKKFLSLLAALWFSAAQAATLLPNGEQQFWDNSGAILALGTVEFYVPATSTPKNTWQDATQATLNTNPVQLDSAGRARIYGNGQYRQIVKDSLGNTIWDRLTQDVYGLVGIEWCGTSAGSANVQTLTPSIPLLSYVAGQRCAFVAGFTNTAATTVNISAVGAVDIYKTTLAGPVPLTGREIVAGNIVEIYYDGVRWNITIPTVSSISSELVRLVTGTSDTLLNGDQSKLVSYGNVSSVAVILPQANSVTFVPGWFVDVQSTNQGLVTITPATSTIDGRSTVILPPNQGMRIVSDGSNYYSQSGRYFQGTLTSPTISTNTNDYAPDGLSSATFIRLTVSTDVNLTGLTGGASERVVALSNVGSNFILTLKSENSGSSAVNRFALATDVSLATNTSAMLFYDGVSNRWRTLSNTGSSSSSSSTTSSGGIIVVQEQLASGTTGSTIVATTWVTRPITTKVTDTNSLGTLAVNQLTLPAGNWKVNAWANIGSNNGGVQVARIRLQNMTDTTTLLQGVNTSEGDAAAGGDAVGGMNGYFTLTGAKALAIQGFSSTGSNAPRALSTGGSEIYLSATFEKVN